MTGPRREGWWSVAEEVRLADARVARTRTKGERGTRARLLVDDDDDEQVR